MYLVTPTKQTPPKPGLDIWALPYLNMPLITEFLGVENFS